MSEQSTIEWTDSTWNPVRGCTKISPGCKHCYASTFARRFEGVPDHPYEQGFSLRLVPEKLLEPLLWNRARRIFVNSMSDLFHPQVPDSYIELVSKVMNAAPWHTFQVLTKRAERMKCFLNTGSLSASKAEHVWWGVSVENKQHGLQRVRHLQRTHVTNRFLSVEPLLEHLGSLELKGISWVIVGGESGPGARPMREAWVTSIRDQCSSEGIPFFFKQWGGVRKAATGRTLQGRIHNDFVMRVRDNVIPNATARRKLAEKILSELPDFVTKGTSSLLQIRLAS